MNKNISKPNDMLISTLVNGEVSTMDLLQNGINAGNTQFLDPESYKETKLIKEKFTDEKGNFREDIFNEYYIKAAKLYEDLAEMNTYKKLEDYIEYNAKDIFAPLDAKRKTPGYEIQKERNPMRRTHGVDSLFEYGPSTKSMRELAQMSKIWDSEKGEWMDKTAEDRGILGSLFGQSLVYATYDEDTEEIDPITGRKIKHKKGEWKLNEDGQYYTETIGNRSGYGKQFVAASDILTKEDSALNKIDFFDSDDIEKSTVGTVMKTVAKIVPYLIPGVNKVWGGVTASLAMAQTLPTFAKMAEGIIVGGDKNNDTSFTRAMNSWENYFSKFDKSYSDSGNKSNWSGEKILDTVSDIFAQLYQMRAAASLSNLALKDPSRQKVLAAQDDFFKKHQKEIVGALELNPDDPMGVIKDIQKIAQNKSPELKKLLEKLSRLSKSLSVGYMALLQSADVYKDALAGGYDRRTAGLAGLTAMAGQYGIMMYEDKLNLGGWFLDDSVGYHSGSSRSSAVKALRPLYDEIKESIGKIENAGSKEAKAGIILNTIGKLIPKLKSARLSTDGATQYLKHGVTEALEEVTEEAVMDATKGAFDFLTWAGMGSNPKASFGVAQDFMSGSFLERYLQNALGGFMGGALFEFQLKKIEPFMNKVVLGEDIVNSEDKASLIHEISNNGTDRLFEVLDEMAELDSDISAIPLDLNDNLLATGANGKTLTRGQATAKIMKSYIQTLEGALIKEGANLTDDEVCKRAINNMAAIRAIETYGVDKLLVNDFNTLAGQVAELRALLDQLKGGDKKLTEEEEKELETETENAVENVKAFGDRTDWNGQSIPFLKELLKSKRQLLQEFLSGKKAEEYLHKTLILVNPDVRNALGALSLYDYTYLKYGKEWKDLKATDGILNQEQVESEYEEWKNTTDINAKFIKFGWEAFLDMESRFSKYVKEYAESGYGSVRKKAIDSLLSAHNWTLNNLLDDDNEYEHIKSIANYLKGAEGKGGKTGDIILGEIFKQDSESLGSQVKKLVDLNPHLVTLVLAFTRDRNFLETTLVLHFADDLSKIKIDELNGSSLDAVVNGYLHGIINNNIDKLLENNTANKTLGEAVVYLNTLGLLQNVELTPEKASSTDLSTISEYILQHIPINSLQELSFGLGTSLLLSYIDSEQIVDALVVRQIKETALLNILNKISNNSENIIGLLLTVVDFDSSEDGTEEIQWVPTNDDILALLNLINDRFDTLTIEEIIAEWATPYVQDIISKLKEAPLDFYYNVSDDGIKLEDILEADNETLKTNASEIITKAYTDSIALYFEKDTAYIKYLDLKNKEIKESPLWDGLEKIASVFTESGSSKVIEILKNNHSAIRAAERFEEFLPEQDATMLLEGALRAVKMYKALVTAMRDDETPLGSPFAINQLMKKFKEDNKVNSSTVYDTIDAENAGFIRRDLDLLEQLIKGYLQLKDRAYVNKTGQTLITKKKWSLLMVDQIKELAPKLALENGGISIIPSDDKNTPEETLMYYAHALYENFHKHCKSTKSKREFIEKIVKECKFDSDKIGRFSRSTNLDSSMSELNDYDVLMWIVTSLGADNNEFYYRYNNEILNNDKINIVPLFPLELLALQVWSFVKDLDIVEGENGDISVHLAFLLTIYKNNPKLQGILEELMIFVNGSTGVGKSTVVGSILSVLLADYKLYITAPNTTQLNNYFEMISSNHPRPEELEHGSIYRLLEKCLGRENASIVNNQCKEFAKAKKVEGFYRNHEEDSLFKPISKGTYLDGSEFILDVLKDGALDKYIKNDLDLALIPEVVFIDESTLISQPVLLVLGELGRKLGIKFILSGDSIQTGAAFVGDTQAFNDLFMFRPAKLNICIRANNNQISRNNSKLQQLISKYEEKLLLNPMKANELFIQEFLNNPLNHIDIGFYLDKDRLNGYKFVSDIYKHSEDILLIARLNKLANDKEEDSKKKLPVLVITNCDETGRIPTDSKLLDFLLLNGLSSSDIKILSPLKIHDRAVQGSEARYVIVANDVFNPTDSELSLGNPKTSPGEILRAVYTFASRALNGSISALPIDIQTQIGIRNVQEKVTQKDELPQLQKVQDLKTERLEEINNTLKDWKPEVELIVPLEFQELGSEKKKIYTRKNSSEKPAKTRGRSSVTIKDLSAQTEQEAANVETTLSEANLEKLIDTTNKNPDIAVKPGVDSYMPKNKSGEGTDSVRMTIAADSINVPEMPNSHGLYRAQNSGINFNFDGICDRTLAINPAQVAGYNAFKNLVMVARNKEDIVEGIRKNNYIAYFIAEMAPLVAYRNGIDLKNWKDNDALNVLYANWFRDHCQIDDACYIFAKPLDWESDKPIKMTGSKEVAGEDGSTVLYYGFRLYGSDLKDSEGNIIEDNVAKPGYINQYFSFGKMSPRVLPDRSPIHSKELLALYDQADQDLAAIPDQKKKFVAYKLPKTSWKNINFTSSLRFYDKTDGGKKPIIETWESMSSMHRRGFSFDTNHIYLINNDKITLKDGSEHYAILCLMAKYGVTAADINEKVALQKNLKKLTFEEHLAQLERSFVDGNGNLRIAGSYFTFAEYVSDETFGSIPGINAKVFRRPIILNSKLISPEVVFEKLLIPENKKDKLSNEIRYRLSSCSPASQTELIISLIATAGGFKHHDILEKYLIGIRSEARKLFGDGFGHDINTLDSLISEVRRGKITNSESLREHLLILGHRVLLMPFFSKFVYKQGSEYKVVQADTINIVKNEAGVEVLQMEKDKTKYPASLVKLSLLKDSVAYPVLARNEDVIDVTEELGVDFSEEEIPEAKVEMFLINYAENTPEILGTFGFQLQDPYVQILNEDLALPEGQDRWVAEPPLILEVTEREEVNESGEVYTVDPRFPYRNPYETLPQRSLDYDNDAWRPVKGQLKNTDYFVDSSIDYYVDYESDKKKDSKKEGKYSKFRKRKFKKGLTRVITVKGKNGKTYRRRIPANSEGNKGKVFTGKFRLVKKGSKPVYLNVINDKGFEIRPGDYVQINGDVSKSFYISRIDVTGKNGPVAIITHWSEEPNGERVAGMYKFKTEMRCPINDVTNVVKRTIPRNETLFRDKDYYRIGNFKEKSKFETGKYAQLFKTGDTVLEMIEFLRENKSISSFDFEEYFYLAVPLKSGETTDDEMLLNPIRPADVSVQIDGVGNIVLGVGRDMIPIDSYEELEEYLNLMKGYSSIGGFTLYRMKRRKGYTIDQIASEEAIQRMVDRIREKSTKNEISSYIAHLIIFNEDVVTANNNTASLSQIVEVPYIISEVLTELSEPIELFEFDQNTGLVDLKKSAKIRQKGPILSQAAYLATTLLKDKYPSKHWIHVLQNPESNTNALEYLMLPRPEFWTASEHKEIASRFDGLLSAGKMSASGIAQFWRNSLQGALMIDRQLYAYLAVASTKNGQLVSDEDKKAELIRKESAKTRIDFSKDGSITQYVILDVVQVPNGKGFKIHYVDSAYYTSGKEIPNEVIHKENLITFLSQHGARFLLTGERLKETSVLIPVLPSVEEAPIIIISKPVEPEVKSEEIKQPELGPSSLILNTKDSIKTYANESKFIKKSEIKDMIIDKLDEIRLIYKNTLVDEKIQFTTKDAEIWAQIIDNQIGMQVVNKIIKSDGIAEYQPARNAIIYGIALAISRNRFEGISFNALFRDLREELEGNPESVKEVFVNNKILSDEDNLNLCK